MTNLTEISEVLVPDRLAYDREYSPDQILNRNMPRRRPSPPVVIQEETEGFASDRVFSVPEPGIHPRIFFGPNDVPCIRERLQTTDCGRQMFAYVREQLARGIDAVGTWENHLFDALERGDFGAFARLYRPIGDTPIPPPGNAIAPPEHCIPATKWHHRDSFLVGLMLKAYCCLLDDNASDGKRVGEVLANYTRYLEPKIDSVNREVDGGDYWRAAHRVVGDHAEFAYAYDWVYNFMSHSQRTQVRGVISKITHGHYVMGMDLPAHWRNWNWIGSAQYFTLISLAIEGEDGYDPRVYARGAEVVRDFLTYGIDADGVSTESIGYHTAGMNHLSAAMIALANRGENLFTHPHYRRQFDQWLLWTLQPFGGEWVSDGDLGNRGPAIETMMIAKYFYPHEPKLDFVYQNLAAVRANNFHSDFFLEPMLICPADPLRDENGRLIDYQNGDVFGLPNTFFDAERGLLITRSDWSYESVVLNFTCRTDTVMASHEHGDRGRFTLAALGRNWVREDSRLIHSKDHSIVLIDGEGQGYFPPAGTWLGLTDTDRGTFGACDAKYAYDWRWAKEAFTWDREDPRLENPFHQWIVPKLASLDRSAAAYDPSPHVIAYYQNYLDGNPLMWAQDSWVVRLAHNPVQRAFRTVGLVRGSRPYVLVIDDIQKDSFEHLYTWLLPLPSDIYLISVTETDGFQDIVLGEMRGNRRLLVRVLHAANADGSPAPRVEKYDTQINGIYADRLVISSQSVAPDYQILLFPCFDGFELPKTHWAGDVLTVDIGAGQPDEIAFTRTDHGRTLVTLQRR